MNQNEFIQKDLKLGKELGSGSFGNVFEGEYHGEKYAIKRIFKKTIDEDEYLTLAFKREIFFLKKMSEYENSVKFYLNYKDDNYYILILELCDTDLSKLLKKKGKFTSSEILSIMKGLNKPFKYMNNNGFLHRDIKPENIMIKYKDSSKTTFIPKVTDYGLARKLNDGKASTMLGSPRYMSPEILMGKDYNDKSDLFSIGTMMYELYFGSFPFDRIYNRNEIEKKYNKKKKLDCEDKLLDDLLNKLLIYEVDKRISWEEYLNHPFFNNGIENLNSNFSRLTINDSQHKIINIYDYVLEKIIWQNYMEQNTLKNINPTEFITIDECFKMKDDSFFILGILAKYLEEIGISVLIEKNELPRNDELIDYHKNIFQFICNTYILKNKYLLDFDLSEYKIIELVKDPIKRSYFNEKLKNYIIEIYNLNEEELLIMNYKRVNKKFTAIIVFKSNFNKNMTKEELINVFAKDEELKTLSKVEKELIIPKIKLNKSMLYPKGNTLNNNWRKGEKRGGEDYIPPLGWNKYGINIKYCFNDKNYDWIGHSNNPGEWCVGYWGIKGITKNMEQIYENDDDIKHPGKQKVGTGVYFPCDPKIMEENTEIINANGENYKVGFMLRIKPDKIRATGKNKYIWIVNGNDNEFRPYGILIKKI